MGVFSFLKNVGDKLTGGKPNAEEIEKKLRKELGDQIIELKVAIEGEERVILTGLCATAAAREKAILIAGNINGVSGVIYYKLKVRTTEAESSRAAEKPAPEAAPTAQAPAEMPEFYTIVAGDTLSKIAKKYYGDANKYPLLFEANREVIKDPNKIYVGQTIRVPKQI